MELFIEVIPTRWFEVPENLDESFKEISELMLESVQQNFTAGGRPDVWEPLAAGGPSHLRQSGALYQSLINSWDESSATVEAGAGLPYARIHHFGGIINHPGSDKLQVFQAGGKTVFAHGTKPHTIEMPRRPYMMFQEGDVTAIAQKLPGMFLKFYQTEAQ